MGKVLRVQTTGDAQRIQKNIADVVDGLSASPLASPTLLRNVSLAAGDNYVNHLLSRPLVGWDIIRRRAASTVFDKQDTNPTPAATLILNASAPVVVDLLVF